MVPDKFNMVDMGGIDLIIMQGEEVPGLYNRLVESIAQCRYQCLYNWLFDGVIIPPTYVELEVNENDEVVINEGVTVSEDDVIHIYSLEPGPVDPEIIPLLAEENGVYNAPAGKDGFNPVTVDVPSYTPVISPITITENGIYNPPSGVDGYSPVTVDVSSGSEDGIIYSAGILEKQSLFIPQLAGNASISFNQDHLYINTNADAYSGIIFAAIKAFDHSQFSNVKMEYSLDALSTGAPAFLGIRSNIDQSLGANGIITPFITGFPDQNNVQKRIDFSSAETKTVITLDVSDVTNDFVVEVSGFFLRGFRIYKLWLE